MTRENEAPANMNCTFASRGEVRFEAFVERWPKEACPISSDWSTAGSRGGFRGGISRFDSSVNNSPRKVSMLFALKDAACCFVANGGTPTLSANGS
jgi:hypothetical protein